MHIEHQQKTVTGLDVLLWENPRVRVMMPWSVGVHSHRSHKIAQWPLLPVVQGAAILDFTESCEI